MIENSQRFKTFEPILKALVENYFKPSIIFLKDLFEKTQYQSNIFLSSFIQTYASLLAEK
jgi:hypothetical protein